jgi:hypothetical protein
MDNKTSSISTPAHSFVIRERTGDRFKQRLAVTFAGLFLLSPLSADYYDTWNTQYQLQRAADAQEEIADTQQLQYISQHQDPCRYIDMGEYLCDENGCEQYAIKTCPQTIPIENIPLNKRVVPYSESDLKKACR